MGEEPNSADVVSAMTPDLKIAATAAEISRRVQERVARGMSRDRALMLTVMEMGGKITIVKG